MKRQVEVRVSDARDAHVAISETLHTAPVCVFLDRPLTALTLSILRPSLTQDQNPRPLRDELDEFPYVFGPTLKSSSL